MAENRDSETMSWGTPLQSGIIKTLIDRELDRKRATFPTLDIRSNQDGALLRHIEPWGSLCLTSAEQDVTITPCRCDEKRPEEGKPRIPEEWFS
jgi:hypothetical protein